MLTPRRYRKDAGVFIQVDIGVYLFRAFNTPAKRLRTMPNEQGTASAVSSAAPSPQPLHNPSQAAVIQPPQAPLGNSKPGATAVGAGHKALLAKKMAKSRYASGFF